MSLKQPCPVLESQIWSVVDEGLTMWLPYTCSVVSWFIPCMLRVLIDKLLAVLLRILLLNTPTRKQYDNVLRAYNANSKYNHKNTLSRPDNEYFPLYGMRRPHKHNNVN